LKWLISARRRKGQAGRLCYHEPVAAKEGKERKHKIQKQKAESRNFSFHCFVLRGRSAARSFLF
jgi:hydroxyacyl-ACP dehydratase HTD2-like protein with hotdog domain